MKKMPIVFYSWSYGNTERIAKMFQRVTGAEPACEMQVQFDSNGGDCMETPDEAWARKVKALL